MKIHGLFSQRFLFSSTEIGSGHQDFVFLESTRMCAGEPGVAREFGRGKGEAERQGERKS